jgi:hypothetical protein
MNARSVVNNAARLNDVIADRRLDTAVIIESWITSEALNIVELDLAPTGYQVMHATVVHRRTVTEEVKQ